MLLERECAVQGYTKVNWELNGFKISISPFDVKCFICQAIVEVKGTNLGLLGVGIQEPFFIILCKILQSSVEMLFDGCKVLCLGGYTKVVCIDESSYVV